MPDEYDGIRGGLSNYERGLYFELGRAHIRGETAERGWVRQFQLQVGNRARILDSARTDGRGTRGVERKSGRIHERSTLEQLRRERSALESGKLTHSRWETVAGEKIPRSVGDELRAMTRDFPGRFEHEVLSRADAARALELGRSLASRLPKVREAAERLRQNEERQRRERTAREAAQRVARVFGNVMKGIKREERAAQEARELREARALAELNELSAYAAQVQQAREAADAAEQARHQENVKAEERARLERDERERKQRERDLADAQTRGRFPPDVAELLIRSRPTPGLEHLHRQPPSPGKTRAGREERARMRDERGRGGREHR
ncbi:hypothetical protein [Nocardia cerradoensis]|uniref:hypothetical protein n=1 Tax=Nocardia cerradoensis TaxID=85688 RepID=UPI0012F6932C|nr:hypothetical protein [Nocardia cerradoensis]NKY48270.1 hypothetical protein [Nocardia cerradoensis]